MKYVTIALIMGFLVACEQKSSAVAHGESYMPASELVHILKDHLPENEANRIESKPTNDEQFDLELTRDQFEQLQYAFTNEVKDYASNQYSYGRFSQRATTFKEGYSTFSISLGVDKDYHYIITGSFVLVGDSGKAVVWIKPTRG